MKTLGPKSIEKLEKIIPIAKENQGKILTSTQANELFGIYSKGTNPRNSLLKPFLKRHHYKHPSSYWTIIPCILLINSSEKIILSKKCERTTKKIILGEYMIYKKKDINEKVIIVEHESFKYDIGNL